MSTPVVHLELHTGSIARARSFYEQVCGWRSERIGSGERSYHALEVGPALGGGMVECQTFRPVWLPYVEVEDAGTSTERARELGATVLLEPRAGPTGWRSVVSAPCAGEIAFWHPR